MSDQKIRVSIFHSLRYLSLIPKPNIFFLRLLLELAPFGPILSAPLDLIDKEIADRDLLLAE